MSALGAIIIVPPVNLLLLKVTKRHRRSIEISLRLRRARETDAG